MRNTWPVYLVDPKTGKIVWTLGGKNSLFNFAWPNAHFAWQHDAQLLSGAGDGDAVQRHNCTVGILPDGLFALPGRWPVGGFMVLQAEPGQRARSRWSRPIRPLSPTLIPWRSWGACRCSQRRRAGRLGLAPVLLGVLGARVRQHPRRQVARQGSRPTALRATSGDLGRDSLLSAERRRQDQRWQGRTVDVRELERRDNEVAGPGRCWRAASSSPTSRRSCRPSHRGPASRPRSRSARASTQLRGPGPGQSRQRRPTAHQRRSRRAGLAAFRAAWCRRGHANARF